MDEQMLNNRVLNSRYKLIKKIGEGGMSIVYLGEDLELSRRVAVKILKFEFLANEKMVDSFKIEAKAVAKLSHENIVKVYDVGIDENINYIIMELLKPYTLKAYLNVLNENNEYMSNNDILHIARQIALALQNAHDNGIIHKDIKPQNIMLSDGLSVKVTDFGIAQFIDQNTKIKLDAEAGSVYYSSPEQLKCQIVDKRTDIYSFGVLLYELSTGQVPFRGRLEVQVALKHLQANFVSPTLLNSQLNPTIENIINYAIKLDPRDRFQKMDDIIELLDILVTRPNDEIIFQLQYPEIERRSPIEDDDVKVYDANKSLKNDGATSDELQCSQEQLERDYLLNSDDDDDIYDFKRRNSSNPNIEYIENGEDSKSDFAKNALKLGITALAGVIIGIFILIIVYFPKVKEANKEQPFVLEKVEGMNYTQASDKLMKQGLMINKISTQPSSEYDENHIISQSPNPGTTVKRGQTVNVIVSSGKKALSMPSLKQNTLREAQIKLENLNIKDIEIVEEFNLLPKSMVISQEPQADTQVYSDTKVKLVVSKGPEKEKIIMPDLSGKTKDEVLLTLKDFGIKQGSITTSYSDTVEKDRVISQSIEAGTEVLEGAVVNLVISLGEENPQAQADVDLTTVETQGDTSGDNQAGEEANTGETAGGNDQTGENAGNAGTTDNSTNKPKSQAKTRTFYIPLGVDNPQYNVKVGVIKDGAEKIVYDKVHNKEEEMVEINIKGSGTMTIRFYIDGDMIKETQESFN